MVSQTCRSSSTESARFMDDGATSQFLRSCMGCGCHGKIQVRQYAATAPVSFSALLTHITSPFNF